MDTMIQISQKNWLEHLAQATACRKSPAKAGLFRINMVK
jgi:hypothetical protein